MKLKDGFKGERYLVLPKAITDMIERDPLASLIYITDIGFYPAARHHFRRRDIPIDQYVFIYCVNGRGWYETGPAPHESSDRSAPPARHEVYRNQYFILPAGVPHAYGSDDNDPWTIYWIHFSGSLAPHYAAGTGPIDITPSMESRINVRNNLFEEIFRTLSTSFSMESIRYAMASFHHYLASLRYIAQFRNASTSSADPYTEGTTSTDIGTTTPRAAQRLSSIELERIVTHYFTESMERTLSLREIADYVGLSIPALSARFKLATGHSPLQYFNLMKIRRACELLDTTTHTIAQISMQLGIEDPYYFSRLFSKTMGISPKAYRNRLRP